MNKGIPVSHAEQLCVASQYVLGIEQPQCHDDTISTNQASWPHYVRGDITACSNTGAHRSKKFPSFEQPHFRPWLSWPIHFSYFSHKIHSMAA